jgi:hypothetical protein
MFPLPSHPQPAKGGDGQLAALEEQPRTLLASVVGAHGGASADEATAGVWGGIPGRPIVNDQTCAGM